VLLVTLRAHGDSSGDLQDFGWSSREDVLAAVEWLERRRPGRPILLHGASMGAAAAVFAAGELGRRVEGYALECCYRDLDTAARTRCEVLFPPGLDALAHLGLRTAASLTWPEWTRVSPLDAIGALPREARVLLLAGAEDRLATLDEQRDLLERLDGRGDLVVIDGADHDRLLRGGAAGYREALLAWLAVP
jgi:alpha-beta hydrolase superfamily lysophospholipase